MKTPDEQDLDWPLYGAEYKHPDGSTYSFHFHAKDDEDAATRLRSIKGNAEMIGQVVGRIDGRIPGAGWWVRLRCWFGNTFQR